MPIWDFYVTRADGTTVRFHTNSKDRKGDVANFTTPPTFQLPGPPDAGPDRSDGPGT